MMTIKCPNPRFDGVAKLNEIDDWNKFLEMADTSTLTVGCPKCSNVWKPENQSEIAANVGTYLAEIQPKSSVN